MRDGLMRRYKDAKPDLEIRQTIYARTQKRQETFREFHSAILDMTISLSHPMPEDEVQLVLRQNMSEELQYQLFGVQFSNTTSLVNRCVAMEEGWARLRQPSNVRPNRRFVSELEEPPERMCDRNRVEALQRSEIGTSARPTSGPRQNTENRNREEYIVCFRCKDLGHVASRCPERDHNIFCYGCGKRDVIRPNCRDCSENFCRGDRRAGNPVPPPQRFADSQPTQGPPRGSFGGIPPNDN